jgi:hypothetical protein
MLPTARAANALTEAEWDWFLRLRNRCVALKTLTTTDEMYRQSNLHRSTDVLVEIMETALYRDSNAKQQKYCETESSQSIITLEKAFKSSPTAEKVIRSRRGMDAAGEWRGRV